MAIKSAQGTVTTTATKLSIDEDQNHDAQAYGRDKGTSTLIKNTGATAFYVGGANVTSSNGFPLAAGDSVAADLVSSDDIAYGVTASGSSTYALLETGA